MQFRYQFKISKVKRWQTSSYQIFSPVNFQVEEYVTITECVIQKSMKYKHILNEFFLVLYKLTSFVYLERCVTCNVIKRGHWKVHNFRPSFSAEVLIDIRKFPHSFKCTKITCELPQELPFYNRRQSTNVSKLVCIYVPLNIDLKIARLFPRHLSFQFFFHFGMTTFLFGLYFFSDTNSLSFENALNFSFSKVQN